MRGDRDRASGGSLLRAASRALGVGLVFVGLGFVGLLAAPTTSVAQSRADSRRARALFEEADAALTAGRFAEARDLLRRSLGLYPHVASGFNLAVAYRGTGEIRAAIRTLDELLDGTYGALDGAQRAQARALRGEVEAELGTLRIALAGPARAEIRVDGTRVGDLEDGGALEWRVDPGPRLVTASAERHRTVEERVEVARGQTHTITLRPTLTEDAARGTLVLEAPEDGDALEIVGVASGAGTLQRRLDPGEYEVRVRRGDDERTSHVTIEGGETLRVQLDPGGGDDIAASPWLWAGVGLAVVGLVAAGLILFLPVEEAPLSDEVWGVYYTLGASF